MNRFEYADELRAALESAGYTYDGVAGLLGAEGHAALARNETVPGLRRTRGGSALDTLVRLFLLQSAVPLEHAERALPGLVERLCAEGLLERSVAEVVARLDLRPYATGDDNLWIVSDLTPGLDGAPVRVGADHVLGISPASTSLAQLTIRDPVSRALDLGTGCGIQALHLATHATQVTATDINRRALWMTQLNASLSRVDAVEVRDGSFFDPVGGERFDLITTNPPFVISPATEEPLVYRDSGLPGDQVVEHIVRTAPRHLTPGGWCQVLANWAIPEGRSWQERLAGWVSGADAWVIQREVVDPAVYVELWLKDAGLHGSGDYMGRYDAWLGWFEQQGIEAVGFGWINLRRTDADATVRVEEWPYDVEQPIAPTISDFGCAVDLLSRLDGDAVLAAHLVARADVQQETLGAPGAEEPHTIVLRQQRGLRRARQVGTPEAALVGACDGELTVGQILDALGVLLEADTMDLRAQQLPIVRELVLEGYLEAAP